MSSALLLAYDTANVVMTALERQQPGETIKQALLAHGPYIGVQQSIQFNATGDAIQEVFTEIRPDTTTRCVDHVAPTDCSPAWFSR